MAARGNGIDEDDLIPQEDGDDTPAQHGENHTRRAASGANETGHGRKTRERIKEIVRKGPFKG